MRNKNAKPLPQLHLPFDGFTRGPNAALHGQDAGDRPRPALYRPSGGQDDGPSRPLASPKRSSVARILDADRADWFVDDEPWNADDAADATGAAGAAG